MRDRFKEIAPTTGQIIGAGRKDGENKNLSHSTSKLTKGKAKRRSSNTNKGLPVPSAFLNKVRTVKPPTVRKSKAKQKHHDKAKTEFGKSSKTPLPEFGNGLTVMNTKFAPLVQVVEELILEGFTLFAGVGKLGKTTIFMQMAKSVCHPNGGDFLGRFVHPGKVLFISLEEDKDSLQEKMEAQGWTEKEGANLTIMTNREFFDNIGALHTEGAINRLLKYVKAGGFLMVGIDPFKLAFKGLKFQNDSDTITIALDPIHYESNNRHFAFLMLDHHGHARGPMGIRHRDPVEDVMSSSTKGSAPDVVIGFYEDGVGKRTILAKGRRVSEQSLKLLYNETTKTNTRIEGDETSDLTGRQAKIVRWLRSHGAPAKNIDIANGTGIAASNTQPIVKSLLISGVLKHDNEEKTYELTK